MRRVLLAAVALAGAMCAVRAGTDNVYLTYHWHLHQPVYWPEKHPGLNRYQFGKESVDLKMANAGNFYAGSAYRHPRNLLVNGDGGEYDSVFDKADRVKAYQEGGRDSIATLGGHANAGACVSYSGALQENIGSFGKDNAYGYRPDWNAGYTQARGWKTSGGFPKADMVGMTYHHAFSPLLPESVLRKEIQIFKEIWYKSWGGNADKSDHSKGFWPVEAAFSPAMIPVLASEGYQWVIVANSHLARTCPNYMQVASRGTGGWNIDPPNRADVLGPSVPSGQWYSGTRDGRGGAFPAPYAYQAHRIKHVDPATGAETVMTAVPMCDYLSYENGYGSMGTGVMDGEIAPFATDSAHPCIVLLAHDGDNAWGGGSSYYFESVPGLMNEATGKGYHPTTIQQFLADHPAPAGDVVHIEDGAWVNAANDWGHPQFINWLWPPARSPTNAQYNANDPRTWIDIEGGWAEDWRNWSVVIAAAHFCEQAEQATLGAGQSVLAWKIQEPYQPNGTYNSPNDAEQAWHYFLGGLDSGFMYYGNSLDDEVKQTLAGNRAIALAQSAIATYGSVPDRTPPTLFKPQRFPWNPGGMGWGPLTGYRAVGFDGNPPYASDFHVWTLVFDRAGVTNVTLCVRRDWDGTNALASTQNETYGGGGEVSAWSAIPMTRRVLGPTEGNNGNTISFFLTPTHMADHYWAKVTGYKNALLDYYVQAVDANGNVRQSVIQHVYVGDGGNPSASVTFSDDPRDCAPLTVTYAAAGGPLAGAGSVFQDLTFDSGANWSTNAMAALGGGVWVRTNAVPDNAPQAIVRFHNGSGTVDDNGGANWSTAIRDCSQPVGPAAVAFEPPLPSGCSNVAIVYRPNAGVLRFAGQVFAHVGHDGWLDVVKPDPPMTQGPDNTWTWVYELPAGVETINCVFFDENGTWDNNGGLDWTVAVAGCTPVPVMLAEGSPAIPDPPVGVQNNTNDAFRLARNGSFARTVRQGGFGSFGNVYLNYDVTNLYIGGVGCDLSGDNNGMVLFLGFSTLSDDAANLWGLSGLPNGLDFMHNVTFTPPLDIAIVVGDEWGDGTFTNFSLGNTYDFGQGIYYLSTGTGRFVPVAGARLAQFDGAGTNVTGATDYDGDRLMNRWAASIPWTSLGATGVQSLADCRLAGLIASSGVQGNDRFLSGNYLGAAASATNGNYGYNLLNLTALNVGLPGADSDADGLPDTWELRYYLNLGFLSGAGDRDGDGAADNRECTAGTDPTDPLSQFQLTALQPDVTPGGYVIRWSSVAGKQYDLYRGTNLVETLIPLRLGIEATPGENVFTDNVDTVRSVFYQVRTR